MSKPIPAITPPENRAAMAQILRDVRSITHGRVPSIKDSVTGVSEAQAVLAIVHEGGGISVPDFRKARRVLAEWYLWKAAGKVVRGYALVDAEPRP